MRHVVFRRFSIHGTVPVLACLCTSGALGSLAFAQTDGAKPTVIQPTKATTSAFAGEFPLEAGDVLGVTVINHPEMSGTLPVSEAGKISLPTLGNLTVGGKTVAQAEKQILAAVGTELNNPNVTVILVSSKVRQVLMVGNLRVAGRIDLHYKWRISEAIDAAGGLTAEPDELVATLARGKEAPIPIDLAKILANPQSPANLTLKPEDAIKINLLPGRTITIAGDVKTPSTITLRRSYRLTDALLAVGGFSQKADTSRVTLIRAGREIPVDATTADRQPDSPANVQLANGDTVVVRAIRTNISIVALHDEVRNSGNLIMEGQPHVLQAVLAANLALPPEQVDVSIRRGTEKLPVDLEKAAYDPNFDLPLQNGDVLLFAPLEGPAVRVAGAVMRPGPLNLGKDATVLDAVLATGGLNAKPEDVKLSILRHNEDRQTVLNVDPVALISLHDVTQNVRLREGDLIMINPAQTRTVFISGEVNNPSAYQMGENDGLVELLLRAGGPTPFAALSKVQILRRDNTSVTVDASKANEPGATRLPVKLEIGDLVTVPRNVNQVLVMNAVNRPGYVPFPENGTLTVGDALLKAGGPSAGAKLQDVAILHRLPNGEVENKIVPLNQVAKVPQGTSKVALTIDTPLQVGDIVYVPEIKVSRNKLQETMGMIGTLNVFRGILY